MKRPTVAAIFLTTAFCVFAQVSIDSEIVDELRNRSDRFMEQVFVGDYAAAFEYAKNHPVAISEAHLDDLEETAKSQLQGILEVYGEKIEPHYIGYGVLSDFLIRFIYVVRYERHMVWWQLVYYRGRSEWQLSSIRYDDDTAALMDLTFR